MRDIKEVLREKEAALAQVSRELEALRLVAPLLGEQPSETEAAPKMAPERAEGQARSVRKHWP
jgi:hypothetical protein